ncbi:MAG: hypothetical protein NZ805_14100 [Armatimonadetes bacterium]|nr:hypothetical protein [Armatimonadota bacterium]MDW8028519.1 DUF6785 family protein [Armatimonadota bacterium]
MKVAEREAIFVRIRSVHSFLIGAVIVALIAILTPYSDLVMQGTWVGLTSFPISAFFALCALVGINAVLAHFGKAFSPAEILLIYTMALVAAGIPSFGWTGLLIPYLAGPFYFATPENNWAQILHPHLPKFLFPQQRESAIWLYEGLPKGVPIPWGDWLLPLAMWTILGCSVYAVFFCLSALLRKPWVEQERLVFPLMQLPLQMVGAAKLERPFFRSIGMWLGFAIAFSVHAINGLRYYLPFLPSFNVHLISLDSYFTQRPFRAITPFWVRILFSIIGLAYFLPLELSFSLWLFYFFFLVQQILADWWGLPLKNVQAYPVKDFVAHQMFGGIIVYALYSFLAAKEHWRTILRKAFGHNSENESDEALPYSFAFWGIFFGLAFIVLWGWKAGAGLIWTIVIFVLFFLTHLVAVRLVCEGGMLYVQHPFRPINFLLATFGSLGIGTRHLPMLVLFDHLLMLDNRSPLMPCILQGLRVADAAQINRRRAKVAMAISVLTAMLLSYFAYLRLMYQYGGNNLHFWFTTYYTRNLYGTWTAHLLTNGEAANPKVLVTIAIGAATMLGLIFMHRNFLWFSVAPIGYLMGASWPMINFWFPVMVAWSIKALVLRYGGGKLYRNLLPFFLGLIFGEFFSAGFWVIVDLFTKVRGHVIFSF